MNTMQEPTNKPKKRGIYILPNLFTIGTLFAGFYAIISGMSHRFDQAAFAIFIAMLLDSLDGRIARLTNTATAFGAEFDSLADMVSFGVAPPLVMYAWTLNNFGKLGWLAAFIYAAAVALRLARFNTQIGKASKRYFQGIPCPAPAGVMAGLIWTCNQFGIYNQALGIGALILTALLGIFMVSNIRYRSFKDLNLKSKSSFVAILLIVLIIVLIAIDPAPILFAVFFIYAFSGPVLTLWGLRQKKALKRRRKLAAKHEKKPTQ